MDWVNIWMETYKKANVKDGTYKIMGYIINRHIISEIGDMKISQVRNIDCQKLINKLNNTPNTQKKVYIYLRDIFSKAVLNKLISSNPVCCKIKSLQPTPSVALTREEQQHLANFRFTDWRLHYYYLFMLYTGCRRSEGLKFNRESDIADGYIHIEGTKNATSDRRIPYFKNIQLLISSMPEFDFVALKPDYVTRHIKDALLNHTLKDLRATFATNCHEQGIYPKVVQKWMGHSNMNMTMNVYTKVLEDFELQQAKLTDLDLDFPT